LSFENLEISIGLSAMPRWSQICFASGTLLFPANTRSLSMAGVTLSVFQDPGYL
jgi:hypothetical protein